MLLSSCRYWTQTSQISTVFFTLCNMFVAAGHKSMRQACCISLFAHGNRSVFFNRGFSEPKGSASGCQGFRRNRLEWPGTKFATTVQCGCSLDHCIWLGKQRKNLGKVPLQQKGCKTLKQNITVSEGSHLVCIL